VSPAEGADRRPAGGGRRSGAAVPPSGAAGGLQGALGPPSGAEGGEVVGLPARRAAYRAVRRVHSTEAWSTRAVDSALRGGDLDARDRSFAANLAYQTLRWEGTLDWALARVLTRPLDQVQPELLDILRLGAWQLLRGGVPDRAAVWTAVDLARAELGPQATGFANGVLRGLARRRDALPWPDPGTDEGLGLALGYAPWIVAEARAVHGDRTPAVLEAGNEPPGLTLRASPPGTRDDLVAELRAAGRDAAPTLHAADGVRVPGADPADLPAVAEGRATPQDEASMLVVEALAAALGRGPRPAPSGAGGSAPPPTRPGAGGGHGALPAPALRGLRVLDAAAAPGGKTTHLAGLGAEVVAADVRAGRTRLVAEAAQRLHLADHVQTVTADMTAPPFGPASFDAVLLDAPCTGLGVVRRRPELRWRRDPGDPARLGALQGELLAALAPLVRPGGVLLYSACTWTGAETTAVVERFLAAEGDRFTAERARTGSAGRPAPAGPGTLLDPAADTTDGFYLAPLRRT